MFLYQILILFFVFYIPIIHCYLLNISLAIVNTQTVIACGLSIDIYQSFDPIQVITCPHIFIDKNKIQLIKINISFDDYHQIKIESYPPIISLPKWSIKLRNNSFISPININPNSTYYLSFSPELTCKFSLLNNETICFYYPLSSSFIHIEYHYDEIQHGNFILSGVTRNKFYIIFIIIAIIIVVIIMCFFGIYIICTSRISLGRTSQSNDMIDSHGIKQATTKGSVDLPQDGTVEQSSLTEHLIEKLPQSTFGNA